MKIAGAVIGKSYRNRELIVSITIDKELGRKHPVRVYGFNPEDIDGVQLLVGQQTSYAELEVSGSESEDRLELVSGTITHQDGSITSVEYYNGPRFKRFW